MQSPILQKIEKMGYTIGAQIGRGNNSLVYSLGSKQVLKITINKEEAYASYKLLGKTFKNVIRVFRVMTPKKKMNPQKYYIILEKLQEANASDEWEILYQFLREYDRYKDCDYSDEIIKKSNSKEVIKAISNYSKEDIAFLSFAYFVEYWTDITSDFFQFDKKFDKNYKQYTDLLNGVKELKSAKITNYDITFDNIMKRNADFVIVDPRDSHLEPIEIFENSHLYEAKVHYARTAEAKYRGLRNIPRDEWAGMMVFENVKEGDIYVGKDCLFDIRIAFLDDSNKVIDVQIIKKDTGRVIAPKGTTKAVETASDDAYQFTVGSWFSIPAKRLSYTQFLPHTNFERM